MDSSITEIFLMNRCLLSSLQGLEDFLLWIFFFDNATYWFIKIDSNINDSSYNLLVLKPFVI